MKQRVLHKRVLIGSVVFLLIAAATVFLMWHFAEPRHQGKSLSYWLEENYRGNPKGREAVLAIGADATPALLRMLATGRHSTIRRIQRIQRILGIEEDSTGIAHEWNKGMSGFFILGEQAAPAIPSIVPLLSDKSRAPFAWDVLMMIGKPALPTVRPFLTSTNAEIKRSAVFAVVGIQNRDPAALEELFRHEDGAVRGETFLAAAVYAQRPESGYYERIVAGLDDPEGFAASRAAIALRSMGDAGTNSLPRLHQLAKTTNAPLATEIASSIRSLEKRVRIRQAAHSPTNSPKR